MSAGKIDKLLKVLSALYDTEPLFTGHQFMYKSIDAIKQGDVPWNGFSVTYNGPCPPENVPRPPWMDEKHEVWFRDPLQVLKSQLANPDFNGMIDFLPKRVYHRGKHQYTDLMSGNWAWEQVVTLAILSKLWSLLTLSVGQNCEE